MEEKDKSRYLGDIEYFSAKLEKDPDSVLFVPLAKAYIKLDKFAEAVQVLTAGIDANTDVFAAKTLLAKAYLGLGNIDDAKAILTEVQVVDRNNYLAAKLMGDVHRQEDDIRKALVSYRNALVVAPEDDALRNLVEELMSASGIAANELEDDRSLMDADDEVLDALGSELVEEVRQEVGEEELDGDEASDDEISSTLDEIVGKAGAEDEELPLDHYQQDLMEDLPEELEEELLASLDDEIVPTDLAADDEIFEPDDSDDESAPDEGDVQTLAAELGADLGLGEAPEPEPDELDAALEEIFDGPPKDPVAEEEGEAEAKDTGLSFFEGVEEDDGDGVPVDIQELRAAIEAGTDGMPEKEHDPVEAAMKEIDAAPEEHGDYDPVAALMAEMETETSEDLAGETDVDGTEAPEDVSDSAGTEDPETAEELIDGIDMPEFAEAPEDVSESADTEDVPETAEELINEIESLESAEAPEDVTDGADTEAVPETAEELINEIESLESAEAPEDVTESADTEAVPETAEELINGADMPEPAEAPEGDDLYEGSMEELLEAGPEEEEKSAESDDSLDPQTREQVNRLENLLETIKNNAGN